MIQSPAKHARPTSASTPSRSQNANPNAHRLLYRGALSLPDSHLLLDGLSFIAETRVGYSPSVNLLSNPLALALESMRGRPSLHLLGTEKLEDVWLDTKNTVNVYIHPYSSLSQIYFENILCLMPITSAHGTTDEGIRISLSESDDPETNDLLIYGQLLPTEQDAPSPSTSPPKMMHILAARILPNPPPPVNRAPRPDDPTPRLPPAHLFEDTEPFTRRKRELSDASIVFGGGGAKRKKPAEDEQVKRAREVMLNLPKPGGPSASAPKGSRISKEDVIFKVPHLPNRTSSVSDVDSDVFGSVHRKGKERESGSDELEKANKTVIKQAAVTCLGKQGIKKSHVEFNDLYQTCYRGVAFALRGVLRTQAVNVRTVEKLLEAHTRMYVNGTGENHILQETKK